MRETKLKGTDLVGYRVHATDGEAGALKDLLIDAGDWSVRYLAVDAEAWAPQEEVLVVPRSLTEIDEARRELAVDLTAEEVRESPSLAAGAPVDRDFEENWYRHHGWEAYWREEVAEEADAEPPTPPGPPVDEAMAADSDPDAPALLRFGNLGRCRGETSDGAPVTIADVLVDDNEWTVDYLEVEVENLPVRERCLVDVGLVDGVDEDEDCVYLAVAADALRSAPRRPHPGVGEDCEVRLVERRPPA